MMLEHCMAIPPSPGDASFEPNVPFADGSHPRKAWRNPCERLARTMADHVVSTHGFLSRRRPPVVASTARRLVERMFHDRTEKRFAVRLWDGTELAWGAERDFTLVFRGRATFASLLATRDASEFARAYVDGRLDIEGDVDAATRLTSDLRTDKAHPLAAFVHPLQGIASRLRTAGDDARDVRAHYDLPDDFFRLFLDGRMVYSCAYFADPAQSLEEAQERKLDLVCRKLQLRPGDSFLDVGCGWGALVLWAAMHYGVLAHGITLSKNQAEAARDAVARAGLSGRVTIEQLHYGDLPESSFDKIASVGMIEHVGLPNYRAYFDRLWRALRPGGLLLNHGITLPPGSPWHAGGPFILSQVFPGADIVDLARTLAVMEQQGFEILDVQSLRPHYALTLREWGRRLTMRRAEAARRVSDRTLRTWDLFLPGCRRAFAENLVSVHQCLAAKTERSGAWKAPLTREELIGGIRLGTPCASSSRR